MLSVSSNRSRVRSRTAAPQRRMVADVNVAIGRQEQDGVSRQVTGEIDQQPEAGAVRPVHIVQQERDRRGGGQFSNERRHRGEQVEPRVVGLSQGLAADDGLAVC